MTTFTDSKGQYRQVTAVTEKFVFAKKIDSEGKSGKGRPGKFDRSEVETIVGHTLEVTEVVIVEPTVDPVTEPVVETENQVAEQEVVVTDLHSSPVLSLASMVSTLLGILHF